MPKDVKKEDGYRLISTAITAGTVGNFYIFHGEERYLLERGLAELRKYLCPDGLDGFNYKRYEGKGLTLSELEDAIDSLPAFAERTFVEVHDFDIFKIEDRQRFADFFSELPDYVCVVFIYDTIEYKPDGRQKLNKQILQNCEVIEFITAEQSKLIKWIIRHFSDAGKQISKHDAEYMALITGGLMTVLHGEIGKTAAYAKGETVTRADIDAVVTPVLDTVSYKLADALAKNEYTGAMKILDELLRMREAPHKLVYSISLKMRQILAARICIDNNYDRDEFMRMCGIRYDFQARIIWDTARKMSLSRCRKSVLICAEIALALNSSGSGNPEACMTELITSLAHAGQKNFLAQKGGTA